MKHQETKITPALPVNINGELAQYFEDSSYILDPLRVGEYSNVFLTHDGLCLRNGFLVPGSTFSYNKISRGFHLRALREWFAARVSGRRPYTLYPSERSYLLIHHPWYNYYHWMLDSLPRLMQVESELDSMTLLLPDAYKDLPYVQESLEFFTFDSIEYIPAGHSALIGSAIIPAMRPIGRNFDPEEMQSFREIFLQTKTVNSRSSKNFGSRIFITRRSADKRHIRNEEEVIGLLSEYAFRVVDLAEHSLADQISIMQHADCVVAGHGAGLANILFLPSGAKVLELTKRPSHPDDFVNGLFFTLSSALSLRYACQLCEPVDPNIYFVYADIKVSLDLLRQNIELLLNTSQ